MDIVWEESSSIMVSKNQYRQVITGHVFYDQDPENGAFVSPLFIIDYNDDGKEVSRREGRAVTTDVDGKFQLAIVDVSVPLEVSIREIRIVVNASGAVCFEATTVERPADTSFIETEADSLTEETELATMTTTHGWAILLPFHGIAMAWQSFCQNRVERSRQKTELIMAKYQAKAEYTRAKAEAKTLKVNAKTCQKLKARRARKKAWQSVLRNYGERAKAMVANFILTAVAGIGLLLLIVFTILTLVGVAIDNPWIWTISPWGIVLSARLCSFTRKNRLPGELQRMMLPRWTTAVVGSWLIFLVTYFTRR